MLPLLLQIDPAFGWIGISFRFRESWRLTAGEVSEHIENQSVRSEQSAAIIKHYRRKLKRLKCLSKPNLQQILQP